MNINNVGYNYRHGKGFCVDRPHGSNDFLFLIIKTPAFFVLDGKKQYTAPNSVILYKKGTPQLYGSTGTEYINDWIHFDLSEDDVEMFRQMNIPFDTIIEFEDVMTLSGFIKSMCYEKYSANANRNESVKLYFRLLFLKLSEKIKPANDFQLNPYYYEMSKLRTKIHITPNKVWDVDEMASELNLSRSYFQHLYRRFFGVSAITDVINSRVEHSKYLLFSTTDSIKTIAQKCGYNNEFHYMRQFKKVVGINPTEYRKQRKISAEEIQKSKKFAPYGL